MQDQPSAWVRRFAGLIPAGEVLDVACGSGRHARLLASLGHPVVAVDRDAQSLACAAGPGISTLQFDLEAGGDRIVGWPFASGRFAGIVVTNYLHRPLLPLLFDGLAPGGILIYETFAEGNALFGKPSNPSFLLRRGELLDMVRQYGNGLAVIAFEDGYMEQPKPSMVQRICAMRMTPGIQPDCLRLF